MFESATCIFSDGLDVSAKMSETCVAMAILYERKTPLSHVVQIGDYVENLYRCNLI